MRSMVSKKCFRFALAMGILWISASCSESVHAEDIDVYFITGQSNATNLFESGGADGISGNEEDAGSGRPTTNVGFNLNFARIGDRSSRDADITNLYGDDPADTGASNPNLKYTYSSSNLNTGTAVTTLATQLHAGNNLGIYGFARGGRPLANAADTSDSGESWYPGADPANGQKYDSELYGTFKTWADDRIGAITAAGDTAKVKGVFWFQGEQDVSLGTTGDYKENYENLLFRLREDFGSDVIVVASDIRVTSVAGDNAGQNAVNDALEAVSLADPLAGVIDISDLTPQGNNNNVHLHKGFNSTINDPGTNQYVVVAERWASTYNAIRASSVPEPGSVLFLGAGMAAVAMRRRRDA